MSEPSSRSAASPMPPAPPAPPVPPARRGARIAGTGIGLPSRVVTNADLSKIIETSDEGVIQRTGIRERRLLSPGERLGDLAKQAVLQALDNARLTPRDLDLIICATITPEMCCPSTASRLAGEIGATPAGAMDLSAACSGFVYGMNIAASLLATGQYRNIAVIGAEALSQITDWKDRRTCVLFGDGAAAAIFSASDDSNQGCLYQTMASDGGKWKLLFVPRAEHDVPAECDFFSGTLNTLQMNGREVFKFAVTTMQAMIDSTLAACGVKSSDLAMVIAHQSNQRILESVRERLNLPAEKFWLNIERYGNTSAASVPICLHEAMTAGRIKKGDLVLFVGIGGGLTWASSVWRM